jgi:mannose-6-phosphate isomerase-like protein (cupin superfamily)
MNTMVNHARRGYGPIVNDTSGMAYTMSQIGGEGLCRWKMLMNGTHLEGAWNCVEYVVIEPGASIGTHVHTRTEEIYFIVSGHGEMNVNGTTFPCSAGDLITAPIGTAHGIANRSEEEVHFFVVEVFPGEGPAAQPTRLHLPSIAVDGKADVDLTPFFTGDWERFRWLEIPAGGSEELMTANTEVMYVLEGGATVAVDGMREQRGSAGLAVAIPPGTPRRVANAGEAPLRLIVTEVAAS